MEKITVFIPAYNAETWIAEAIESVLQQTYQNFHLMVIDDGSSDKTADIAEGYADPRINVIRNGANLGVVATRNKALAMCPTRLLACLDADDIATPNRLELQMRYLAEHPLTTVLGGQGEYFGDMCGKARYPVGMTAVNQRIPFDNPFMQNTVVLDADWLRENRLYYAADVPYCEDYDFWSRIHFAGGILANLPDCLVKYRVHPGSVSRSRRRQQEANANRIRKTNLARYRVQLSQANWDFLDAYQFDGRHWPAAEDRARLREIDGCIKQMKPDSYERLRFLCSALPRPQSLKDKVSLASFLIFNFGWAGIKFVAAYLRGSS